MNSKAPHSEGDRMLNFRKLKQDFSSNIVKEGRDLFDQKKVVNAKILHLDNKILRVSGKVQGQYENTYESHIEIDRQECETVDSDCDCPYNYDCQHLAALLFHLEEKLDEIMVAYSKETDIENLADQQEIDDEAKQALIEKFKAAETKQTQKQEELYQKQVLQEYISAVSMLAISPFFRSKERMALDSAEALFIVNLAGESKAGVEFQLALRLPSRSKPLYIPHLRNFFDSLRHEEPIFVGPKRYCFGFDSFSKGQKQIIKMLAEQAYFQDSPTTERGHRFGVVEKELLGDILSIVFEGVSGAFKGVDEESFQLTGIYDSSLENPLKCSPVESILKFSIEHIQPPVSKILLTPNIVLGLETISVDQVKFFECSAPGMIFQGVYYRFSKQIDRNHLRTLLDLRDMVIPEPLFGTFVENALPELSRFAQVENRAALNSFVTLPFIKPLKALCSIGYLDGELEASLCFQYDEISIPAVPKNLTYEMLTEFVSKEGILARNVVEERKILEELFQDFTYNPAEGVYVVKSDKKIVEFMTDIIPKYQDRVEFDCPQNLLDQFIYDQSTFELMLKHTDRVDAYQIELKVNGSLRGIKMDTVLDCLASRKPFIELENAKLKAQGKKGSDGGNKLPKILVLDLEKISGTAQLFDELGIQVLENHTLERPIWSLANIDEQEFQGLPVQFSMTERLKEIRQQMLGQAKETFSAVPSEVAATLRNYQLEGVHWLERLRTMFLGGILADDMGLGKTLQAIVALAQYKQKKKNLSLIVCPTSLLYNWKEEFSKFNPNLKVFVVDGSPVARKKMLEEGKKYDVLITSYTLLQKDVEIYQKMKFGYLILDEAQHIKNRGTRNAKSVKQVPAEYRLILSGTPIENSLDELWSLFDFLMPGFLNTYDRFVEKYIRVASGEQSKNLEYLKKKVSPFILRRMKTDVLDDLPPVSEIVYHCQLSGVQQELYRSYAASARDELVKLVERDGFDRVQIHVLATLTRLKQICCHPGIFATDQIEAGDSSKYDMLMELVQTLIEGGHKTVIFSQYTKMLQIMRSDLEQKGVKFLYLDGSSKNRLEIVKEFNQDATIPIFLVSLKAGGTGLNLVGADTVIHYDMWWNPAVESQATDRVHRMGQKQNVSVYKLITLGTIEEKIAEMQKRKKGLVKKVVSCDDEAIAKLTWEDVLELLRT